MTRDEELKALGEELGAALFTWYQYRSGTTCPDTADVRLYQVVGRCFMPYYPGAKPAPEPNKPVGFVVRRPWSGIPAGWFVKAPNGTWYEIKATRRDGARQTVTILVDGREATFSYPVDTLVSCRRGTHVTEVSDAVDVLGEGAEILEDRT